MATPEIITLNVGGRIFQTRKSTLTSQSDYFATLLSGRWDLNGDWIDGGIFVDANPSVFEHILDFLRRSVPPVFWTRTNGFDYPRYAILQREAEYFGITSLVEWISQQRYHQCIMTDISIETRDLSQCLERPMRSSFESVKEFLPGDYTSKGGGVQRKRIQVQTTTFQAPVCFHQNHLDGWMLIRID